jgi:hypothetical protein
MATAATHRRDVNHSPTVVVPKSVYRFSVEQYHCLIEHSVFAHGERVELLDGWLVPKMPHSPPHDGSILLAQTQLLPFVPVSYVLRIQSSITLATSEPEPDLVLAIGLPRRYVKHHPRAKDIGLLIEVADSSLSQDRDIKGPLYSRARIPIYWIVNLIDSCVEVYTLPRAGRSPAYRQRQDFTSNDAVPLVIEDREITRIPVRDLLP